MHPMWWSWLVRIVCGIWYACSICVGVALFNCCYS